MWNLTINSSLNLGDCKIFLMRNKTDTATLLFWSSLFLVEGIVVVVINFLTLLTFTLNSHLRRRSVYFLINLSFADMFVGVAATMYACVMLETGQVYAYDDLNSAFTLAEITDIFASTLSLIGLVLISFERMLATVFPFRHRSASIRAYVIAGMSPWSLAIIAIGFYLVSRTYFFYTSSALTFLSVVMIGVFYSVILVQVKLRHKQLFVTQNVTQQREYELAKTLFVVTCLSMLTWLPNAIWTAGRGRGNCSDKIVYSIRFVNSFVNSFVYLYRMKGFRTAFAKLVCGCSRDIALSIAPRVHCTTQGKPFNVNSSSQPHPMSQANAVTKMDDALEGQEAERNDKYTTECVTAL